MKKKNLPPMKPRLIYVQYVCVRKCRRNPSADRFTELDSPDKQLLFDRWSRRHNNRRLPDIFE